MWADVAYRLWRRSYTPRQIAHFLNLEGWRLNADQVRRVVEDRGRREARQWVSKRLEDGAEGKPR